MSPHRFAVAFTALVLATCAAAASAQVPVPTDTTGAPVPATTPAVTPASGTPGSSPAPVIVTPSLPSTQMPGTQPTRPTLVTNRSGAEVEAELSQSRNRLANAENAFRDAQSRFIQGKGTAEIKKKEIDMISERLKVAKQAKDANAKADYERQKKAEDLKLKFFEAVRDAHQAEVDRAAAERDFARAAIATGETELALVNLVTMGAPDAQRLASEQKLLEALRNRAQKMEALAKREDDVATKKLKVYQAWATVQAPVR